MGNSSISSDRQPEDSKETPIDQSKKVSTDTKSNIGVSRSARLPPDEMLYKLELADLSDLFRGPPSTIEILNMVPTYTNYVFDADNYLIKTLDIESMYYNQHAILKHLGIRNKKPGACLWFTSTQMEEIIILKTTQSYELYDS